MILEGLKEIHAKGILHRVTHHHLMIPAQYLKGFEAIKYSD